jgi:hypothetical protein
MCGRFILLTDLSVIITSFDIQEVSAEYRTGSNICPGVNDRHNGATDFRRNGASEKG